MSRALAVLSLCSRVERAIERDALLPPGVRVLVACSGGADSVALSDLLCALAPRCPWSVAGLVHVNHRLRGAAADEDEEFCRELAGALEVPIIVERVDVAARARADRISVEAAGHRIRYEVFQGAVEAGVADRIATAHTRDDQAETVLLRLLRGAGPAGLAGIRPRAGAVVRPLLDVRRSELRDYLRARSLSHREDPSNRDPRMTRNRIRHTLLPLLAAEFSPAIAGVLARDAAIARADADWIEGVVNEAAARIVRYEEERVDVDAARLAAEPPALARRVARRALERAGSRRVGFDHVERFLRLAGGDGEAARRGDFPGSRVERIGAALVLTPARGRAARADRADGFEYALTVPGDVAVTEVGVRVSATLGERPAVLAARGDTVAVRAASVTPPLTVRSWRPGDRFRPLGLSGRKKLQDFFVDRKIARERRAAIPVVADATREIVWVAGHAVAEGVRLTDAGQDVIILRVGKLGACE